MPHQNQFSFQNRGFLGGAVPQHQIGPPRLESTPLFPGNQTRPIRRPVDSPFQQNPFPIDQGQTTGPGSLPPGFGQPSNGGGSGGSPFGPGFIDDIFAEEPGFSFFGALANQNLTPNQNQFFQTQFQPFFNRFLGQSANLLQGGTSLDQIPSFQNFVGGVNFQDEFRRLPPSLRPGSSTARFRPPTEFRF